MIDNSFIIVLWRSTEIVELLIEIQSSTSMDELEPIKRLEELRVKFPPNWIVELASSSTTESFMDDSPSLT